MYKLLVIPVAAYIEAWFELIEGHHVVALGLGILAFMVWLGILDTQELMKEA